MSEQEVPVGKIIETLKLIKSRYKQLSLPELKKVRLYVNDAWQQLYPSYKKGGYTDTTQREALQLVIDLQRELKVELDARKAAEGV